MPRVVHFELTAHDPDRALRFYGDVFGWSSNKWDGPMDYWLIKTGAEDAPGINGGLGRAQDGMEAFPSVTNTIDVPSVDAYVEKITAHGGQVVMPKMAIPGVGYLAYFKDTEGNTFGIMQDDPTAAS